VGACADKSESIAFLQKVSQVVKPQTEPYVLIVMETAAYQLSLHDVVSTKKGTPPYFFFFFFSSFFLESDSRICIFFSLFSKAIEESEKLLDALPGAEPIIHASFYRVSASFDQVRRNYAGFYKNSLLYLACVSLDTLSQEEKLQRTYDLGIAALLGETIYNFGELVRVLFSPSHLIASCNADFSFFVIAVS